jgi:nitrite reductase/ring-hydroxylating ferredoxin subunit
MIESNASQLIAKLSKFGLTFKSFSLTHRGHYSANDADWNYKDIPHLAVVHKLVESSIARADETTVATINVQKILGFRFPLVVYNYQPKGNPQTYFTTLFFYTLIIETDPKSLAENECEVVTTYNIGSSKLWMLFFPILKFLLKRNYKDLMSTDIPMRSRRGELRDWGYQFKYDKDTCTFIETVDTSKKNLWHSSSFIPLRKSENLPLEKLKIDSEHFFGRSDHQGVRIKAAGDRLLVFPRLCPHEGANLDESACSEKAVKCPWHLRAFASLADFKPTDGTTIELEHCVLKVENSHLSWTAKS